MDIDPKIKEYNERTRAMVRRRWKLFYCGSLRQINDEADSIILDKKVTTFTDLKYEGSLDDSAIIKFIQDHQSESGKDIYIAFECSECGQIEFGRLINGKATCTKCGHAIALTDNNVSKFFGENALMRAAQSVNEKKAKKSDEQQNASPAYLPKARSFYYNKTTYGINLPEFKALHEVLFSDCAIDKVFVTDDSSSQGRFGDAYGALILKEARCEGYAKAAKLIMDRCGLSGIIARGEAVSQERREPHAWIIAECDGNNYHFDFTWNAIKGLNGIPGVEYMFLDDETIGKEHFPSYAYPVCSDATKMFWVVNNGIIKYHSDLSRIKIVPVKNNYIAVAKIPQKLSKYEVDNEVINWMINDLAAYSYGSSINFSYNEPLDLLVFYFLN